MKVRARFVFLSLLLLATVARSAEPHALAAAKLIVADRAKAEQFYVRAKDPSDNIFEVIGR
jgi:hypothetical protein